MDEALAWKRGHRVVLNLHWVFRPLTTTPSSWRVCSDWPGHCPSPPGFQLVSSLLCQSQQEALSDASPNLRTAAFLKYYLKCFVYLAQLEALNIPYTLEMFMSSPKEGMIKGLWKNHSNEPQAVRLVADLCLEYQVYDLQLWNSVLQKLLSFNMTVYLQKVLEALMAVPSLLEGQGLSRTWRNVIQAPFLTASLPLSPQQQDIMYKTFVLLLKCPFLLTLDLVAIAKRFSQFNLQAFSLGALLLIPCVSKKNPHIQSFLSSCNPILTLDQVEETMATGELAGVPSQIRDTVFMFLCGNGRAQTLIKSKHFTHLKRHLITNTNSDIVEDLLNRLVQQNSEEEAVSFAQEYLTYRELKGGEASDAVREFLEKTMESRGTKI
ncbi:kinetochore-associated protein 1-like [Triplophysa dalaica]|uniref:kinetochore-associated protein 1-like n=1 Tax=Triplophysa dalaica TaxID=1582913 RepID=UPI0024DF9CA6|nr:kinetochore-associated protein 1-like [Triplophysa dalaica]